MTSREELRRRIRNKKHEDSKLKQKINDWKFHKLNGPQSCSKNK